MHHKGWTRAFPRTDVINSYTTRFLLESSHKDSGSRGEAIYIQVGGTCTSLEYSILSYFFKTTSPTENIYFSIL